jgi:hypothetical protein
VEEVKRARFQLDVYIGEHIGAAIVVERDVREPDHVQFPPSRYQMPDGAAIDADKAPGTINRLRLWRRRVHLARRRFAV